MKVESNYIFPKILSAGKFRFAGHSFQASKLKLDMNDPLMGADVLGYSDIRISTSGFFGYLALRATF